MELVPLGGSNLLPMFLTRFKTSLDEFFFNIVIAIAVVSTLKKDILKSIFSYYFFTFHILGRPIEFLSQIFYKTNPWELGHLSASLFQEEWNGTSLSPHERESGN